MGDGEKHECPWCKKEYTRIKWLSWHIWREHTSSKIERAGLYLTLLFGVVGIISLGLTAASYLGGLEDSQKLDDIHQAFLCTLTTGYDNATNCLEAKHLTLEDIDDFIHTYSGDVNKFYELGIAYTIKGDYDTAVIMFNQALEDNPLNYRVYRQLGWVHYKRGDYPASVENYMKCLEDDPGDVDCGMGVAMSLGLNGDFQLAKLFYEVLNPKLESDYICNMNALGIIYLQEGECEKALDTFTKISLLTDNACVHYHLSQTYGLMGDAENCEKAYIEAESLLPDYFGCYPNSTEKGQILYYSPEGEIKEIYFSDLMNESTPSPFSCK